MKVSEKSDSEDIRIYIDGFLHIRLPRDKNLKLHSWIEGHSKKFFIEIYCKNHLGFYEYDNKKLWCEILKIFDKIL
jgi:hypothetical protein